MKGISRPNYDAQHLLQDLGIWQFWQYFLILLLYSYVERTPNIAKIAKSPGLAVHFYLGSTYRQNVHTPFLTWYASAKAHHYGSV